MCTVSYTCIIVHRHIQMMKSTHDTSYLILHNLYITESKLCMSLSYSHHYLELIKVLIMGTSHWYTSMSGCWRRTSPCVNGSSWPRCGKNGDFNGFHQQLKRWCVWWLRTRGQSKWLSQFVVHMSWGMRIHQQRLFGVGTKVPWVYQDLHVDDFFRCPRVLTSDVLAAVTWVEKTAVTHHKR